MQFNVGLTKGTKKATTNSNKLDLLHAYTAVCEPASLQTCKPRHAVYIKFIIYLFIS